MSTSADAPARISATVAAVIDDAVVLNRGTADGVVSGMMVAVGDTVDVTDPDTGAVLGQVFRGHYYSIDGVRPHLTVCYPHRRHGTPPPSVGTHASISLPVPPPVPGVSLASMNSDDDGGLWPAGMLLAIAALVICGLIVMAIIAYGVPR